MKLSFLDQAGASGMLKIGIVETVIALPHILSSFNDQYPNVELSLIAGVTDQLVQDVIDMKLDGAFVTGPIRHPNVEQLAVIQEKLVLVSKRDSFTMDQLTTTPFLLYHKGCGYRGRLESWMKVEGIIPRKVMEFGTFGTIIGSVSAGIGVTIIPQSSVIDLVLARLWKNINYLSLIAILRRYLYGGKILILRIRCHILSMKFNGMRIY